MIIAIIQARAGSTRLPGKIFKKIKDRPILRHVIERVKKSKLLDKVVVATTQKPADKETLLIAERCGVETFTGDEDDVLDRYYKAAKKFRGDTIVRITADCPLIDPAIIDSTISLFLKNHVDYASNVHPPTYPDGMDVEIFSFKALEKAWKEAKLKSEREHVTPYFWKNTKLFKCVNFENSEDLSDLRMTVDKKEDLIFVNELLKKINLANPNLKKIIEAIKKNPELLEINKKFSRNEGYEKSLKEDKK